MPTIVRKRHAADPRVRAFDARPDWQPHREWIRPAQSGSVSTYTGVQRSYATKVVDAGPWDTATISELAAKIVELAACGSETNPTPVATQTGAAQTDETKADTMKCVAHFAWEVSQTFKQRLGDDS